MPWACALSPPWSPSPSGPLRVVKSQAATVTMTKGRGCCTPTFAATPRSVGSLFPFYRKETETQKAQSWEMLELDANPGCPRLLSQPRPCLPDGFGPSWPDAQAEAGSFRPLALGHGRATNSHGSLQKASPVAELSALLPPASHQLRAVKGPEARPRGRQAGFSSPLPAGATHSLHSLALLSAHARQSSSGAAGGRVGWFTPDFGGLCPLPRGICMAALAAWEPACILAFALGSLLQLYQLTVRSRGWGD